MTDRVEFLLNSKIVQEFHEFISDEVASIVRHAYFGYPEPQNDLFLHELFSCFFGNGGQKASFNPLRHIVNARYTILGLLGASRQDPHNVHIPHGKRDWAKYQGHFLGGFFGTVLNSWHSLHFLA